MQTLTREIAEELSVSVRPASAVRLGVFEAQADSHPDGVRVRMTCYTAEHQGTLTADSEIEEVVWLSYADRHRVSPVGQLIFDHLRDRELLR